MAALSPQEFSAFDEATRYLIADDVMMGHTDRARRHATELAQLRDDQMTWPELEACIEAASS